MKERNVMIGYIVTEILQRFPGSRLDVRPADKSCLEEEPDAIVIEVRGAKDKLGRIWEFAHKLDKLGHSPVNFHILVFNLI